MQKVSLHCCMLNLPFKIVYLYQKNKLHCVLLGLDLSAAPSFKGEKKYKMAVNS